MLSVAVLLLILSFAMLYYGAEFSLDASEIVGKKLGLSPLIIGMILVGFGTSLPEAFVGHIAALNQQGPIALGSLVGSNIANMYLILGLSSLFAILGLKSNSLRPQLFTHLLLGAALWIVLKQEVLTLLSALPLLFIILIYMFFIYREIKFNPQINTEEDTQSYNMGLIFLKMLFGFGLLFIGGELLVKNATELCKAIGIDEYVISAILVAFGTSFPELVTSLMAAIKKKETDLIIGNIVGSNLFNCALILGSLGIYDFKITVDLSFEIISLLVGSALLVILNLFKINFNKLIGVSFLLLYGAVVGHWIKLF